MTDMTCFPQVAVSLLKQSVDRLLTCEIVSCEGDGSNTKVVTVNRGNKHPGPFWMRLVA